MKSPIQAQPTSPQECPVILLINATPFLLSHRGIWSKMMKNFRGMDMITVIYRVTLMCVAQRRGKTFQCVRLASLLNETGCALSEHPIFPPAKTQAQGLAQLFVLGFECLHRVNKAISAFCCIWGQSCFIWPFSLNSSLNANGLALILIPSMHHNYKHRYSG